LDKPCSTPPDARLYPRRELEAEYAPGGAMNETSRLAVVCTIHVSHSLFARMRALLRSPALALAFETRPTTSALGRILVRRGLAFYERELSLPEIDEG
jgi:hypothetical protein